MHIEICEKIESKICEEFGLEKCEKTYEIAADIFNMVIDFEAEMEDQC